MLVGLVGCVETDDPGRLRPAPSPGPADTGEMAGQLTAGPAPERTATAGTGGQGSGPPSPAADTRSAVSVELQPREQGALPTPTMAAAARDDERTPAQGGRRWSPRRRRANRRRAPGRQARPTYLRGRGRRERRRVGLPRRRRRRRTSSRRGHQLLSPSACRTCLSAPCTDRLQPRRACTPGNGGRGNAASPWRGARMGQRSSSRSGRHICCAGGRLARAAGRRCASNGRP